MKGIDIAENYEGYHENRDTEALITFFKAHAKKKDIVINPATTPWCAAFINACERAVGNPGTGKLNARSFLAYGEKIDLQKAEKGDIVVFKRGGSTWQGHVSYFYSYDMKDDGLWVLGGNQADMVRLSFYPRYKLLGVRRYVNEDSV